ncbi:MAG TPA: hypothetical protein VKG82_02040 [Solirubrobacteraceae bacterium]|nr:hypothetical protein [Solirubrobacteraceae bacterium]
MSVWVFVWLMVILKIPIVALFLIVRWAVRQTPETGPGHDGGVGPRLRPPHPYHPRSRLPRPPRRGPHGEPALPAPARVRSFASKQHLPRG